MSNFSPYSNFGYLSLIKETTEGVAVTPTEYLRIISESVTPDFGSSPVQEVAGDRERNIRSVKKPIEIGGDIEFFVENKMIGHFLRGLFGAPVSQELTASVAYRHGFIVSDTPKTYTIDIQPADAPWVHRYFGVQISGLNFEPDDNKIKCTASVMPRKAFINTRPLADVSSGNTLTIGQTEGLTTSDTILVLIGSHGYTTRQELTITSIDSETQLTVSTITQDIITSDIVVIKRATPSYDQDPVFTLLGGSAVYVGDNIDDTSEECKEEFTLVFNNATESKHCNGLDAVDYFPSDVLTKGYEATGSLTKYYDKESNLAKAIANEIMAIRLLFQGETALEANVATKASSTWGATANGFRVESTATGKAGNDYSVTIVIADDDTLAASISDKTVTISLANTTASKNTGTLIAAAVDALSGVNGTAEGSGVEQFTTAEDSQNLGFRLDSTGAEAGTNVVGRDASEKPYLQFDNAAGKIDSYFVNNAEDSLIPEAIPFTFYKDTESGDTSKKWSARVFLLNSKTSY
jgi:hypothetical protein